MLAVSIIPLPGWVLCRRGLCGLLLSRLRRTFPRSERGRGTAKYVNLQWPLDGHEGFLGAVVAARALWRAGAAAARSPARWAGRFRHFRPRCSVLHTVRSPTARVAHGHHVVCMWPLWRRQHAAQTRKPARGRPTIDRRSRVHVVTCP